MTGSRFVADPVLGAWRKNGILRNEANWNGRRGDGAGNGILRNEANRNGRRGDGAGKGILRNESQLGRG